MSTGPLIQEYKILSSDADLYRRLRISRLFTLLQEAAIAHTEALGFGREMTLDRGYLWVVALQQVRIRRLPCYDETVRLESIPGETMHTLYPRHTRMTDRQGNELLSASAIWTLIDARSRTMTAPEQTGVQIHAIAADWQGFFPKPPRAASEADQLEWTVPYSAADLNGHMNNAKYLDLAEDLMPERLRAGAVREIFAEYAGEVLAGERLRLCREAGADRFLLTGHLAKRVFRIGLNYDMGDETA